MGGIGKVSFSFEQVRNNYSMGNHPNITALDRLPVILVESNSTLNIAEKISAFNNYQEITLRTLSVNIKDAPFYLRSIDKELGYNLESKYSHDKEKAQIPPVLTSLPECDAIWDMIRSPSADVFQIKKRQKIVETFIKYDSLSELQSVKNKAYKFNNGVQGLFKLFRVSEWGPDLPALTILRTHKEVPRHVAEHVYECLKEMEEGKSAIGNCIELLKA